MKDPNIKTLRSLDGFIYLNELIVQTRILILNNPSIEMDTEEAARDLYKEITRTIDVIDMKLVDQQNKLSFTLGDIFITYHVYLYIRSYMKLESLMFHMFCKKIYELNEQVGKIIGEYFYPFHLDSIGYVMLKQKCLDKRNGNDINNEYLNHGFSILRRTWITYSNLDSPVLLQVLVNAVILCIAREIDRLEDTEGICERHLIEAKVEGRHNSKALEKGICLVTDILIKLDPSATQILEEAVNIVEIINYELV